MKSLTLSFILFFGLSASAQITKADITQIMADIGTKAENITTVYVGNTMTYYKSGDYKKTYTKYNADKGNGVTFTDSGIRVNWKPEGTMKSVFYIPFASIITFDLSVDYLAVYVKH